MNYKKIYITNKYKVNRRNRLNKLSLYRKELESLRVSLYKDKVLDRKRVKKFND